MSPLQRDLRWLFTQQYPCPLNSPFDITLLDFLLRTCHCLKLSCILICLLFDHHLSLPLNWAKSSGLQRAWPSCWDLIISPGAVAGTQHVSYKDFLEKKKNEMTPLFSSWGPYLQNKRPGLDQWFSKWISRTNASWELVRNADSQVQLHTNHVRDSGVGPQDLWFSSPAGAWMFTRVWGPLYHMISEASF